MSFLIHLPDGHYNWPVNADVEEDVVLSDFRRANQNERNCSICHSRRLYSPHQIQVLQEIGRQILNNSKEGKNVYI